MTVLVEQITDKALLLPSEQRLALVEMLLASLNVPTQAEVDKAWAEEAERRVRDVDDGKVTPLSGEKVFRDLRRRLAR